MNDVNKGDSGDQGAPESGLEKQPKKGKKSGSKGLVSFVLFIILVIAVVVVLDRVVGVNIFTSADERQADKVEDFLEETGAWHAVFLTNGQVYFGQLSSSEAQFSTLKDVYYLQLQQGQQPAAQPAAGEEGAQVVPAPQPTPPQLTLIKFGTELHGPQDYMMINRDHVLFWEELRNDSNVVKAILNYKESLTE